jgi:hypothetical protein
MSSSFGRKKPAVRQGDRAPAWLPRVKTHSDRAVAEEMREAFYRITHTEPSRLERARMIRGQRIAA